jgi:deoxyxylulose-5-phosphate synthase
MLTTAYRLDGPSAVRYPRGTGGRVIDKKLVGLPVGKGEIRRRGRGVALLAFGSMLTPALAAAEELDATVANMRFVKPIDRELILGLAAEHSLLISVEENALIGGAGSEVARVLEDTAEPGALAALGNSRPLHRAWRPGAAAGRNRPRPGRHRPGGTPEPGQQRGFGRHQRARAQNNHQEQQ